MANDPADQANSFQLEGDGIHVSYAATSFSGVPLFSYQDNVRHLEFSGDQIKVEPSAIGDLVSVVIVSSVDANRTTFTLVAPNTIIRGGAPAHITTFGVTTLHRFSIIGRPTGQTEIYTTHALKGSAEFVVS